jgi:hypothetical protein
VCSPATGRYWARAECMPPANASLNVQVGYQDGGSFGLFTKVGNGPWQVSLGSFPPVCREVQYFPRPVLTVWGLPTSTAGIGC